MELLRSIITLLVGSAVFITGMNMMSAGLKKAGGKGIKKLIKSTQNNGVACLGIGAGVTALIQSSAATSVMAIGFVSAGIMTVFQAVCIALGAFLGTTVTGILASLSSFNVSEYFVVLAFIGVVLMFFKKELIKNIGEICAGLGLLFFGLATMKSSIMDSATLLNGIKDLFTHVDFPPLLMLIGALFTALVQSSSATTGVAIVLLGTGAITTESGFYLVIGATIGTMITTVIATIGTNVNPKRFALSIIIIRILSALAALAIIWPVERLGGHALSNLFSEKHFGSPGFALAIFLVVYNIIFISISYPFIKPVVSLANKTIKDKEQEKQASSIKFIDDHLLNTPSVALMQVKQEIYNMFELSYANYINGYERVMNIDRTKDKIIIETEDQIDYINKRVSDFLIALSNKVSLREEKTVGSYFHVINDIERIGDHAFNFYESSLKMNENDLEFSDVARVEMSQMNDVVIKMFELALHIFKDKDAKQLKQLHKLEDETDKLKSVLSAKHFERITKNQCKNELTPFYSTLVSELERVADHLVNIAYSIDNPIGDAEEDK